METLRCMWFFLEIIGYWINILMILWEKHMHIPGTRSIYLSIF